MGKSGVRGVYYRKNCGRWHAQITCNGELHYLGMYATLQEAKEARSRAEQKLFGQKYESKHKA